MSLRLGDKVTVRDEPGQIRYIGETKFASGIWYGVELQREIGKNDGSVNGVSYFECGKNGNYGVFVRKELIQARPGSVSDGVRPTSRGARTSMNSESSTSSTTRRTPTPTGEDSRSPGPDQSTLHKIIEKLQTKLQTTTQDIKGYRAQIEKLEQDIARHVTRSIELESNLEMMTTDVAFQENSKKELYSKLNDLQLRYDELKTDYQIMQEEMELNKQIENEIKTSLQASDADNTPSSDDVQIILQRNSQLEAALMSLQTLTHNSELNLNAEITSLKSKLDEKEVQLADYSEISRKLEVANETIESLQSQLDSALSSEKMIEYLNLENEKLQEKVKSLQGTVDELSELHELDKSLEENQHIVEEDLRSKLKHLSEVIRNDQGLIKELEKKNTFLASKLQGFKTGKSDILEDFFDSEERSQLLKQIESQKLQIKNLHVTTFADSVDLLVAHSEVESLRNKLLIARYTSTETSLEDIIHLINSVKTNISKCVVINGVIDLLKDDITVSKIFQIQILNSSSILQMYLEALLRIFEYNFSNKSLRSNLDSLKRCLQNLELSVTGIIESLREQNYETIDTFFHVPFITELSTLVPLNLKSEHSNYNEETFACYGFVVKSLLSSSNSGLKLINAIKKAEVSPHHYDNISRLSHKLIHLNEKFTNLCQNFAAGESDINIIKNAMDIKWSQFIETNNCLVSICGKWESVAQEGESSINEEEFEKFVSICNQVAGIVYEVSEDHSDDVCSIYQELEFARKSEVPDNEENSADVTASLKARYSEISQTLLEKDQLLDEFRLNVQMLEGNMKSLNQAHSVKFDAISSELRSVKMEHEKSKKQVEELLSKNLDLEAEIQSYVKSSQMFTSDLGNFEDMKSENEAGAKLALLEEIVLLRKMVHHTFSKQVEQDDYSWLEKPLFKATKSTSTYSEKFIFCSKTLRDLASQTKPVKISNVNNWQPRASSQKYIALSLQEKAQDYYKLRDSVLKSPWLCD